MSKKRMIMRILLVVLLVIVLVSCIRQYQTMRLFDAIDANDYEAARTATRFGADVNSRYRAFVLFPALVGQNPTPLIEACYRNSDEIISLLLEKGADVNRCDNLTYVSPLFVAVGRRNNQVAYQLIDRGADINVQAIDCSILSLCCGKNTDPESENHIMFRYLLEHDAALETPRGNVLHDAIIAQDAYVVEYLLNHNLVDPSERDRNGRTALELAKELGYDQIAEIIQAVRPADSPQS